MADKRNYRKFSADQKLEVVLAGIKGGNIQEVCRNHEISPNLYYRWRDQVLEGGRQALAGKSEREGENELRKQVAKLERALGKKTYELELAGNFLRDWE
jgi:transposase-like protein